MLASAPFLWHSLLLYERTMMEKILIPLPVGYLESGFFTCVSVTYSGPAWHWIWATKQRIVASFGLWSLFQYQQVDFLLMVCINIGITFGCSNARRGAQRPHTCYPDPAIKVAVFFLLLVLFYR